jgi:hypothetical protein
MKQLLNEWYKYLQENSIDKINSQVESLVKFNSGLKPEHQIFVCVKKTNMGYTIYYGDLNGEMADQNSSQIWGDMAISQPRRIENCSNGLVIAFSETKRGWGPLLYEVALEIASNEAGGLIADRTNVSEYAAAVWEKYLQRPDVKNKQLDNLKNDLTKNQADNCGQTSALSYANMKAKSWSDKSNPLSKIYKKTNKKIINLLTKHGFIIF